MTNERNALLPLTYRKDVLNRIMPHLLAGECCSLIGTSGSGKSNLARFLRRRDVQEIYWGKHRTWVILIDSHNLVLGEQPDEYALLELMFHRLLIEAEAGSLADEFLTWGNDLQSRLIAQPSAMLALRYIERLCARICEQLGFQIIFVFDQFDDIWHTMKAQVFLNLRNLRDQFKYQLSYLVMTRERLQRSRGDAHIVEAFWELFASHTYGLGMYCERDAVNMLERIAQRLDVSLADSTKNTILELSGRHPGLLRAVFWAQHNSMAQYMDDSALLAFSPVLEECAKIWVDLSIDEQSLVARIARGMVPQNHAQETLIELQIKEIITVDQLAIFSPVFAAYVRTQADDEALGIVIDTRSRQVWLDGQLLESPLSPLEFALLEYLARRAGAVCTREEILRALYKEDQIDVNDQRLDTVLKRLREALHEEARNPRFLKTHRGVGVQLQGGRLYD